MTTNLNIYRIIAALLTVLLSACAEKGPVLIDNIKYQAHENKAADAPKVVIGVSPFRDDRSRTASVLGKRTIRDYIENDLVIQGTVADLVTTALKDALKSRGISVKDAPFWDIRGDTVKIEGADILLGGEIKTLWVEVVSQPLNVKEQAEVKLRVSVAGTADHIIFRTLVMNSKMERQGLAFSLESVQDVLSEALSSAIDELLKDDEFRKKIK